MVRKIKDLAVKTREYTNTAGEKKANWQNIGSIMENDEGRQFILLDRWVNLAGIPDYGNKPNPTAVLVNVFEPKETGGAGAGNNYQPSAHSQAKAESAKPPAGGDNMDDDIPF